MLGLPWGVGILVRHVNEERRFLAISDNFLDFGRVKLCGVMASVFPGHSIVVSEIEGGAVFFYKPTTTTTR